MQQKKEKWRLRRAWKREEREVNRLEWHEEEKWGHFALYLQRKKTHAAEEREVNRLELHEN